MASIQNDARLFGLDLTGFGGALHSAWRGMGSWPIFTWLEPRVPVRVVLPDASVACALGPDKPLSRSAKALARCRFEAIQLPEDILLRRTVALPALASADRVAALSLEVQGQSPFPPDQLLWVSHSAPTQSSHTHELALTSRALVQAHLDALQANAAQPADQAQKPELWVPFSGDVHEVLPGFGERRRQQHIRNVFRFNLGLWVLALSLAAAVAGTPTLQLRFQAIDAGAQYRALQQQVAPVLLQREAFVKAQEQLQSMRDAMGPPMSAVYILDVVTRAVPNDTSVLTFQLQPSDPPGKSARVQITGQTNNTAALMQHLGQQQGVRDVKAPTAAVKPPGASKESYAIEFSIGLPGQDAAP